MSTLNMPGFTAEQSLRRSRGTSFQASMRGDMSLSRVVPQVKVIRVPTVEIQCSCGGYCSADGACRYECYCFSK